RGMIFGAAFEGNLELAPQVLVVLVSHQVTEQSFGIRPDVKGFAGRSSGAVTCRDIAHGISASLTRGNSRLAQKTQERRCFFEFHVIYLGISVLCNSIRITYRSYTANNSLEAAAGIEPALKVLQTFALPLGYAASDQ